MTSLVNPALSADSLPGEAVVALYFMDQLPLVGPAALLDWRMDGQLTRMLLDGQVKGKAGEHVVLENNGKLKADWVLFVGGGKWQGLCAETYASLVKHMVEVARQAGFKNTSLCLALHEDADAEVLHTLVNAVLEGQNDDVTVCWLDCESVCSTSPVSLQPVQ